jgi:hypothetical protein
MTDTTQEDLQHLIACAYRKPFLAELVAACYNHYNYRCDIWTVMRYTDGEAAGDGRLKRAVYFMLEQAVNGVESHEYLGEDAVTQLIAHWKLTPQSST